jgi:hypothetical protein
MNTHPRKLIKILMAGIAAYLPAAAAGQSIFKVVPTPNENFDSGLFAVSASSPSDIWAVGQSAIHFDGTKWTAFRVPMVNGDNTSELSGVADFSPTNAWAVGYINISVGIPNQVIEQWNGTAWSLVPGPTFASGDSATPRALAAISPTDMWAVGSLLNDNGNQLNFLFEHYDGTSWTATTIVNDNAFLLGASADATNDVWAVGYRGNEMETSKTLVYHYDGMSWSEVPSPNVGPGASQLNGVVALASNDVWAVGFSTSGAPPNTDPTLNLIEHYDGTSWSVVTSPNVGPNSGYQSNRLEGITAVSSDDVWAFGSFFAANGSEQQLTLLLHWDGTSWTVAPSPNPSTGGFVSDLLFAGVAVAPNDVWLVGAEDEAPRDGTMALHSTMAGN